MSNIVKYTPQTAIAVMEKELGLELILDTKPASLAKIRLDSSQREVKALVICMIDQLQKNFNFDKVIGHTQISMAANTVLRDYWHLSIEDIALCFQQGIRGDYGPLYHKFDITDLTRWFDQYVSDRLQVAEQRSLNAHISHTQTEKQGRVSFMETVLAKPKKI